MQGTPAPGRAAPALRCRFRWHRCLRRRASSLTSLPGPTYSRRRSPRQPREAPPPHAATPHAMSRPKTPCRQRMSVYHPRYAPMTVKQRAGNNGRPRAGSQPPPSLPRPQNWKIGAAAPALGMPVFQAHSRQGAGASGCRLHRVLTFHRSRHPADPPKTCPQRADQRVHARRLRDGMPAGHQPNPISERDRSGSAVQRSARTLRRVSRMSAAVGKRSTLAGAHAFTRNSARSGLRPRRIVLGSVAGTPAMGLALGNGWWPLQRSR